LEVGCVARHDGQVMDKRRRGDQRASLRRWDRLDPDAAVRTGRLCPGETSGQVGGMENAATQARRFECDVVAPWLGQQFAQAGAAGRSLTVRLVTQQHISRLAPVGDDHGPVFGSALGTTDILTELAAREDGDCHGRLLERYGPTILQP
jgi:hypothetical protein